MSLGRVLSGCAATLAVAGCAVVAVGMSRAASRPAADTSATPTLVTHTARPAYLPATIPAAATTSAARSTHPATTAPASSPAATSRSATHTAPPRATRAAAASRGVSSPTPTPTPKTATATRGQSLPVRYSTGTATRVITVVARSTHSTTATLQAWTKAPGGGWLKYGSAVTAHVGSDGLTTSPSEYKSATPIGSFTLTHAFGRYSDPGTALPYLHTNRADWWISQPGSLYNTHQRCWSGCAFTRGAPNEHLYYETPYYNYAVVIDYNTRNAPGGVVQGAGSAFFLHVTDGNATAGCVAIGQSKLVSLMRWLTPTTHPRIVIGVA